MCQGISGLTPARNSARSLQHFLGIVVAGNDEGCDLYPDAFLPEQFDVMLNRLKLCSADLAVELIITLQIDVYAVQKGNDLLRGLFAHVAVADKDILQARLVGQSSHIKGILKEDGGLGIGVGDGLTAEA